MDVYIKAWYILFVFVVHCILIDYSSESRLNKWRRKTFTLITNKLKKQGVVSLVFMITINGQKKASTGETWSLFLAPVRSLITAF